MNVSPLALFVTWTVYGTFLSGDARGWMHRERGHQFAEPALEEWTRDRLSHPIVKLNPTMRKTASGAIDEICQFRTWRLWAASVRSNHVHVVVTAANYDPSLVRDQLKAKCTTELRRSFSAWHGRPVWTAKGEIQFLDTEEQIEQCVIYVNDAQDRKGIDR